MRTQKTLTADPTYTAEMPYEIDGGVNVDPLDNTRPNARKAYDEWTRSWNLTPEQKKAEDEAWAARSGPVYIIKEGKKS